METEDLKNRFTYHTVTKQTGLDMEELRNFYYNLSLIINNSCPESREKSLAVTQLEQSMFWAISSIARQHDKKEK